MRPGAWACRPCLPGQPAAWLLACLLAATLAGCTVVQVHNATVDTQLLPGVAVVHVHAGADHLSLVRQQGIGLSVGARQATLGLLSQTTFVAQGTQPCGTFIVTSTAEEMRALQQWLQANAQFHLAPCVLSFSSESNP